MSPYEPDLHGCPPSYLAEMRPWLSRAQLPVDLTFIHVLKGEFRDAIRTADDGRELRQLVLYLERVMPKDTWGSEDSVAVWIETGGYDLIAPRRRRAA